MQNVCNNLTLRGLTLRQLNHLLQQPDTFAQHQHLDAMHADVDEAAHI